MANHRDEMVQTLVELLQIESVQGHPADGQPFGPGPANALAYVLDLAARHGLRTANIDGYAGHAEYGEGDEYVAVLSHLDVVPAGAGWTHPPFAAEIHHERVFARGAIDDKGPALSTLWALIALRELGVRPRRKIRLIFGLNEESGWACVRHYFTKQPLPLGGFTPDAEFPLIYAEKGVATLQLTMRAEEDSMSPRVVRFAGGQRVNMVPDAATVEVDCLSETAAREWEQRWYKEAKQKQIDLDMHVDGTKVWATVRGVSAHGSTPDAGVNALIRLAFLLSLQPVSNATMWRFIAAQDPSGKALGIDMADEVSGSLTVNLGTGALQGGEYVFCCDVRYPVRASVDDVISRCQARVPDRWHVRLIEHLPPLYVPKDSPVVSTLLRVYQEVTGDPGEPLAIGGATYARAIPNVVAFGPRFPHQPDLAHQRDESWSLQDYLRCVVIYARAMAELAHAL
ncbi:dipeptidase PepV [Alicyclobacillus cellulosilyticus]|uniref:dipeptidase PepV n=1 Tax=Alicyclobacillus cellulosilyticus TaxID=1003997 RepID=UPI001E615217|nr:dipeptidase PepV [Alicyclobacillus cellulosilyticus]